MRDGQTVKVSSQYVKIKTVGERVFYFLCTSRKQPRFMTQLSIHNRVSI